MRSDVFWVLFNSTSLHKMNGGRFGKQKNASKMLAKCVCGINDHAPDPQIKNLALHTSDPNVVSFSESLEGMHL